MTRSQARGVVFVLLAFGLGCGHQSPSSPTRYGAPILSIQCDASGASPLECRAPISSCGLYDCAPDVPADVTQTSRWVPANPDVVRVTSPGEIVAVSPGDTYLMVTWEPNARAYAERTLSVFSGSAPVPTFEVSGDVYQAGGSATTAPIDGAVVEVLDGYLRGHRVTSGIDPIPPPGFHPPPLTTGGYRLLGVPPGTYRLRVSKNGYLPQQVEVVVEGLGSVDVDVALQRQP